MPSLRNASLKHAAYYVQLMYQQNQNYLRGGKDQVSSLQQFETELPNLRSVQDTLLELLAPLEGKHDLSQVDEALLEISNTIPDAGAYLISLKLNALERIQWLEKALSASRKLQNDVTTQAHVGNLGLAYCELGEFSQAIEYFQQAFQLSEKIGDRYHEGAWLGNLGNIYSLLGEHEQAITYHQRHLDLMHEIQDLRGEGHALANLGVSYASLGQLPKAIQHYKQHLSLARQLGDRHEESRALMNLGFSYYDVGDLDEASHSLNSALQITNELKDPTTHSLVMGGLADIAIDRNEYSDAIQMLQEALEIMQDVHDIEAELRLTQSLGNAYFASDDFEHALEIYARLFNMAQSLGARAIMCGSLANQTSLYRHMGDFAGAIRIGTQGVELARQTQSKADEAFIGWQFALISEATGAIDKAESEMKAVIELEEAFGSLEVEKHREYLKNLRVKTLLTGEE